MPSQLDTIPLGSEFLDRRVKLLPCQKERIAWMYGTGTVSQRKLAAIFGVDKRLIQFVLRPELLEANIKARKLRGGSVIYYEKDKHTEAMRAHRAHKRKVFADTPKSGD